MRDGGVQLGEPREIAGISEPADQAQGCHPAQRLEVEFERALEAPFAGVVLPYDETKYIQEFVDLLGITPNLVESSDPAMWFYPEDARRSKEFPGYPNDVSGEWQPIASNGLQKPYIPALRG
jgi:hypothetical protein